MKRLELVFVNTGLLLTMLTSLSLSLTKNLIHQNLLASKVDIDYESCGLENHIVRIARTRLSCVAACARNAKCNGVRVQPQRIGKELKGYYCFLAACFKKNWAPPRGVNVYYRQCALGYELVRDYCYKLVIRSRKTTPEAQDYCLNDGANGLAAPRDLLQGQAIISWLSQNEAKDIHDIYQEKYLLGFRNNRGRDVTFPGNNDLLEFELWAENEPNNEHDGCVAVGARGWFDVSCDQEMAFMCQERAFQFDEHSN